MDPVTAAPTMRHRHVRREDESIPSQTSSSVVETVKGLDMFPKVQHDSAGAVRTTAGATVSAISFSIMAMLFLSEFISYLSVDTTEHLVVDTLIGQKIKINFDITFPVLPCSAAGVDAMDVTGDQQVNVIERVTKQRIDKYGDKIGGVIESADVMPEVSDGTTLSLLRPRLGGTEGCQLSGSLKVNKVAGNFHIALGQSHSQGTRHVHHFVMSDISKYNVTHTINHLSFGEEFPGANYPLDGVIKTLEEEGGGVYQYFIKIVPTMYEDTRGNVLKTNQYSVTDQFKGIPKPEFGKRYVPQLPGLFFIYDLSPFMVRVLDKTDSFTTFLVNVCAIIGGVFTVTGIVDSVIYHLSRRNAQNKFGAVNR